MRISERLGRRAVIIGERREGGAIVIVGTKAVELPPVRRELVRFVLVREVGLHIHVVGVAVQSGLDTVDAVGWIL